MPAKKNITTQELDDFEASALDMAELQAAPEPEVDDAFHAAVEERQTKAEQRWAREQQGGAELNTEKATAAHKLAANHQATVMARFGDNLPYDRTRLVNETRFYMAQSAEAMLEAGKRLIVLKENEPHGDFCQIVTDQLNMDSRIAQKVMQAAVKFLSPKLEAKAKTFSHLGKSKLYDLMLIDDEELVALSEGGTVAGMTLDDVDRMSCRELRKALRDARANADAKEQVMAGKDRKINELDEKLTLVATLPQDEITHKLRETLTGFGYAAEGIINGKVRQALKALNEHHQQHGGDSRVFAAGAVAQLDALLDELRNEFDLPRQLDGDTTPNWLRDDADDVIQQAIKGAQHV